MAVKIGGFTRGWQNRARQELMRDDALFWIEDCEINQLGSIAPRRFLKRSGPFDEFSMGSLSGLLRIFNVEGRSKKLIYWCQSDGLYRYNSTTAQRTNISSSIVCVYDSVSAIKRRPSMAAIRPLLSDYTRIYITDGVTFLSDNGTSTKTWGIDPPGQIPTASVVTGESGGLSEGEYGYVVTFYDADTGAESDPSPEVSIEVSAGALVRLVGIPVSNNSRVTSRRIYRTVANGGTWYLAAEIPDNVVTEHLDYVYDADLTTECNTDQGIPPEGDVVVSFQDRLWMAGDESYPNTLYFSRASRPDNWPSTYYLETDTPGEKIRNLVEYDGKLYVLTYDGIYGVSGSDPDTYVMANTRSHVGVYGRWTVAAGPDGVYFLGRDGVYRYDGFKTESISEQIAKLFDDTPARWNPVLDYGTAELRSRGVFRGSDYFLLLPLKALDGSQYHRVLVYSTDTQTWTVHNLNGSESGDGKSHAGDLETDAEELKSYITNYFDEPTACEIFEADSERLGFDVSNPVFVTKAYPVVERKAETGKTPAVGWIRRYRIDADGSWALTFYLDDRNVHSETLSSQSASTRYDWHDFPPKLKGRYIYIKAEAAGSTLTAPTTYEFNEVEIR